MPDLPAIYTALGRLTEAVETLKEQAELDRENATESRAELHRHISALQEQSRELANNVKIAGLTSAQVREELKGHSAAIEEWKNMKRVGLGLVGLLALGGLSLGAILAWAGEATKAWIIHLLRGGTP